MGDVMGRGPTSASHASPGLPAPPWAIACKAASWACKAACSSSERQIVHVALPQRIGLGFRMHLLRWTYAAKAPGSKPRGGGAGTLARAGLKYRPVHSARSP